MRGWLIDSYPEWLRKRLQPSRQLMIHGQGVRRIYHGPRDGRRRRDARRPRGTKRIGTAIRPCGARPSDRDGTPAAAREKTNDPSRRLRHHRRADARHAAGHRAGLGPDLDQSQHRAVDWRHRDIHREGQGLLQGRGAGRRYRRDEFRLQRGGAAGAGAVAGCRGRRVGRLLQRAEQGHADDHDIGSRVHAHRPPTAGARAGEGQDHEDLRSQGQGRRQQWNRRRNNV